MLFRLFTEKHPVERGRSAVSRLFPTIERIEQRTALSRLQHFSRVPDVAVSQQKDYLRSFCTRTVQSL